VNTAAKLAAFAGVLALASDGAAGNTAAFTVVA
jgi:hypothetical protein